MDYTEVMDLAPEELRIRCAEAEGWKNIRVVNSYGDVVGVSPSGEPLTRLPDYSDPREYMRLMEKIWKVEKRATIGNEGVCWEWDCGECVIGVYSESLGEAIMRAFLVIYGEE